MTAVRRSATFTFWLGLLLLAGAAALYLRTVLAPSQGLEDLGNIVGAMLLVATSGLVFGLYLWLANAAGRPYPPAWRLVPASLGALLALLVSFRFAQGAVDVPQWGLLAAALLAIVVSAGGLLAAGRMVVRRRAA